MVTGRARGARSADRRRPRALGRGQSLGQSRHPAGERRETGRARAARPRARRRAQAASATGRSVVGGFRARVAQALGDAGDQHGGEVRGLDTWARRGGVRSRVTDGAPRGRAWRVRARSRTGAAGWPRGGGVAGSVGRGEVGYGVAGHGEVRPGRIWRGMARCGRGWLGAVRSCLAWLGSAGLGKVGRGLALRGQGRFWEGAPRDARDTEAHRALGAGAAQSATSGPDESDHSRDRKAHQASARRPTPTTTRSRTWSSWAGSTTTTRSASMCRRTASRAAWSGQARSRGRARPSTARSQSRPTACRSSTTGREEPEKLWERKEFAG